MVSFSSEIQHELAARESMISVEANLSGVLGACCAPRADQLDSGERSQGTSNTAQQTKNVRMRESI